MAGFGTALFGTSYFGSGTPPSDQFISPASINTGESIGVPTVAVSTPNQTIAAVGIASAEALGLALVVADPAPSVGIQVVLFSAGREGFLDGSIDWDTGVIKAALMGGYAFSDAHRFVSDVTTAGGSAAATTTLIDRTTANGVADAGDTTFSAVAAGPAITSAILFQSSAPSGGADVAPTAQRLIAYIAGLSLTPSGVDITLSWSSDRSRIFML
jgi:hypothetical protein